MIIMIILIEIIILTIIIKIIKGTESVKRCTKANWISTTTTVPTSRVQSMAPVSGN